MIGPLPPPVGGSTLLLKSLIDALALRSDVRVSVVDTVGVRGSGVAAPFRLLRLSLRIAREMRKADVAAVHVVVTGMHVLCPIVACAASVWRRPFIVRKFGGPGFGTLSALKRASILRSLRRASLFLVESRELVRLFRERGIEQTEWYANSRPMPPLDERAPCETRACRSFVFIGRLCRSKGLLELAAAAERLPEGVTVDVYGIPDYDLPASTLEGRRNLTYHGSSEPDEVPGILASHDALVLPTYYPREGYAGVILEAYAAGLPVISTLHGSVPELVDESTGILVEPRDVDALYGAMLKLATDRELCGRLRDGVRRRRGEFSDDIWQEKFVEYCRDVVERGKRPRRASGHREASPGPANSATDRGSPPTAPQPEAPGSNEVANSRDS
jgi:glycosyltransferase involved in cell wall biosynthesis